MTENEVIKITGNNATEKEINLKTLYQLVEKFNRGHWGDIQLFEDEENIIINEEDMQKIVDEKIKEIELDIQKIRAKAIDEFAEKICEKYTEEERNRNYRWYSAQIKQNIADIAEQMKAGGENEND